MMYHDEMRKTTPPRPLFLAADADAATTTTNNRMEQINLDDRMRYNLWWYRPGTLLPSEIEETDRRPPCLLSESFKEILEHFLTRLSHYQRIVRLEDTFLFVKSNVACLVLFTSPLREVK